MNPQSPEDAEHQGQGFVAGTNEYAQLGAEQPEAPKTIEPSMLESIEPQATRPPLDEGLTSTNDTPEEARDAPQEQIGEQLRGDEIPEGATTIEALSREIGKTSKVIKRIITPLVETNPDLVKNIKIPGRPPTNYLLEPLVSSVRQEVAKHEPATEDMETIHSYAQSRGLNYTTVQAAASRHTANRPDLIVQRKAIREGKRGTVRGHLAPELIAILDAEFDTKTAGEAPPEMLTLTDIATRINRSRKVARDLVEQFRETDPDEFRQLVGTRTHRLAEHYTPKLAELVEQAVPPEEKAPEGWTTAHALGKKHQIEDSVIRRRMEAYRSKLPDGFGIFLDDINRPREHYSPELITELELALADEKAGSNQISEQARVSEDLRNYLEEIRQGESMQAQEFRKLTELFGAERAVDLLYQYHPEYKDLPLRQVRSLLADYLGDFLVVRGQLNLDNIELAANRISNPSLREGLLSVIKADVLRFHNQVKKSTPTTDSEQIIPGYLDHLRQQTAEFTTAELDEVIAEVEAYYQSVFEVQKPGNLRDELREGRAFPDLNQRINIKEIEAKNRMLIADEMGIGKSASSILAKETLGVKQALIVVPSNVVEVWQGYLSDSTNEDGSAIGYFKEGQAPRVLTVTNLDALEGINPDEYDYIILSQERLRDDYTEAMSQFNYEMLIVDEAHKLKNIATGKRAENLIKLSENISGDEGQQYLALLSGTPVPNKIGDVAMTLRLLYPEQFEHIDDKALTRQILQGDVLDLRSLLVPRMQMKSLNESVEMPGLHESDRVLALSKREEEIYSILLEEDELTAAQKLQILRQSLMNPGLLDVTPDMGGTKITEVGNYLQEAFTERGKIVLFVNGYVEGVIRGDSTIFDSLGLPADIEISSIEGSVSRDRRLAVQHDLQHSDKRMLLAVGGQTADVGVDFSGADEVVFYNEPWTEYDKKQQLARAYRPGLQHDLVSTTFYTGGTIEEGIHEYIEVKYQAIEKLLRGIPISELEQSLLEEDEKQTGPNLEVNPELARYYFSSWDRMMKIYGHVKEIGEPGFRQFLAQYGRKYAESYTDVGNRSYQANAARLSGSLIDTFARERGQAPQALTILDIASGPEMLKRHIPDEYASRVVSLDINRHHFEQEDGGARVVGSFLQLPIADKSLDYANLSLALHYTSFVPSKGNYERLTALSELNRVLDDGGRAVVSIIYSLDLKDEAAFYEAADKLGFRVVEEYSGEAEAGSNFKAKVITLEKVADCPQDQAKLIKSLGKEGLNGLKFATARRSVRNSRKTVTNIVLGDNDIPIQFNEADQEMLEEEQGLTRRMEDLRDQYGAIEAIPKEEIEQGGLSRFFNGKRYVLFRHLKTGPGAVVVK